MPYQKPFNVRQRWHKRGKFEMNEKITRRMKKKKMETAHESA